MKCNELDVMIGRMLIVIMTDSLEMIAIQQQVPFSVDAVAAVLAGNDLILIIHTPEHQAAAFQAIQEAVKEGL
jgi:beta-glucosidase-like glycosyl hydrolase